MERVYSLCKAAFLAAAAATRKGPQEELEEPVALLPFSVCLQSSSSLQEQPSRHLLAVKAYGCQGALE